VGYPILANTPQVYQFVEKEGDNTIPVAYQAFPKEWVTLPGLEIFIAPTFEANGGVAVIQHIFGAKMDGTRVANPENPADVVVITKVSGEELP
jgi:hypothetical protein